MRVHVSDPDPSARHLLRRFLEARGVRVSESADPADASGTSAAWPPDVIVSELHGPVTATVERLRRIAPGGRLVLWTESEGPAVRREARRLGCAVVRKSAPLAEVAIHVARPPRWDDGVTHLHARRDGRAAAAPLPGD